MRQIYLGGKFGSIIDNFALVDDEDYDYLNQWKWYAVPHRNTIYACRQQRIYDDKGSHQIEIRMHRVILDAKVGNLVDHADRNGINNQKYNLRECSNSQNRKNSKRQANNTSGYKGVCLDGNWYRARVNVNGKRISLGYFPNAVDAAIAYDKAAKEFYGEFALLNFPN